VVVFTHFEEVEVLQGHLLVEAHWQLYGDVAGSDWGRDRRGGGIRESILLRVLMTRGYSRPAATLRIEEMMIRSFS